MLQMLRTTTIKLAATVREHLPSKRPSPYQNYMCYQDGQPFMVINAPSLDHARFIVAGFSRGHTWMLMEMAG